MDGSLGQPERFVAPLLDQMKIGRWLPLDHRWRYLAAEENLTWRRWLCDENGQYPGLQSLFVGDSRSDALAARRGAVALSYGCNHGRPMSVKTPSVIDDLRLANPLAV